MPFGVRFYLRSLLQFALLLITLTSTASPQSSESVLIEDKLRTLRTSPFTPSLPELPDDFSDVPSDWLAFVSWNVQIGATSLEARAPRPAMVSHALRRMLNGSYQLIAIQEVPSTAQAAHFTQLLPDRQGGWHGLLIDTAAVQDNGFWIRSNIAASDHRALFVAVETDANGRPLADSSLTTHPPQFAHITIGDIDFSVINVHLTFAGGDTTESAREMRAILDYVDHYFSLPNHDPDIIIAGDFNIPSRLSGQTGRNGITLDDIIDDDPRFRIGSRRLVVTVHEPTSRRTVALGGAPANNYDHFIFSADMMPELIQARRLDTAILTDHPDDPTERLTSDHFPVVAFLRTQGPSLNRDLDDSAPSISGIVNGASFRTGLAPGAWASVLGRNLASTTRTWRADEIINGRLPASLDDVRVFVNGKAAAIFFISSTQINFQVPDDPGVGPASVEVQRGEIMRSLAMADVASVSPALFPFDPDGRRYAAAVHPDGAFVGRPGLFDGAVNTRPARPGEIVLLFGTGFGPTSPSVPSGTVFVGAAPTIERVHVAVGDSDAEVLFSGLVGAGLYQLNVRVPTALPSGDHPVVARVAGVTSATDVHLTVQSEEPLPDRPTAIISVEPETIVRGQATLLRWASTGADTTTIVPELGAVAHTGEVWISPRETTTYTIRASGRGGFTEAAATVVVQLAGPTPAPVVISQIYGGGGNVGAELTHDFVELFNRGATPVDLSGWSLQYGKRAVKTAWTRVTA